MPSKNKMFVVLKWLVLLAACGFLAFKLANIAYWVELKNTFRSVSPARLWALLAVWLLMPLNWWLEALKWRQLLTPTVSITGGTALRAVLAGLSTGFITPNRIGEFAGRILFLPSRHRSAGVALSAVNGLTQQIVTALFGLIGAAVYFSSFAAPAFLSRLLGWVGGAALLALLLYFFLPALIQKRGVDRYPRRLQTALAAVAAFRFPRLAGIMGITALRYAVFCTQYYLMLCFFGISVPLAAAWAAIPTYYLLVAFTPSLAAAEPALRGSYAVFIFGVFSPNIAAIALAGIALWLVNFALPLLVGVGILAKHKEM